MGYPTARVGNCGRCRRCAFGPGHPGCGDASFILPDGIDVGRSVGSINFSIPLDASVPAQILPHLFQAVMTSDVGPWFSRVVNLFCHVIAGRMEGRLMPGVTKCSCPPGHCWAEKASGRKL